MSLKAEVEKQVYQILAASKPTSKSLQAELANTETPTDLNHNLLADELYQTLLKQIKATMDVKSILSQVITFTGLCRSNSPVDLINLSISGTDKVGFDIQEQHANWNVYFIQRLIHDKWLLGDVILYKHRPETKNAWPAQWNLFYDARSNTLYSLDSCRKLVATVSKNSTERPILNKTYDKQITVTLLAAYDLVKQECFDDHIKQLKSTIENTTFAIGSFGLFKGGVVVKMANGCDKRLPHRVAEIYQFLREMEQATDTGKKESLWKKIHQSVFDALDNPRYFQKESTADFYRSVLIMGGLATYSEPSNQGNNKVL